MNNGDSAPRDNESTPEPDESEILQLRRIWKDAVENFEEQIPDVPDVSDDNPQTADMKLRAYVAQLQDLIAASEGFPGTNIFDRCLGVQRWHLGKALLLLKPLTPGARGLIKHGDWQPFIDEVGLDEIMAWRCRAIADNFPKRQDAAALEWQWTAMIDALPKRKKEADDDESEEDREGADEGSDEGADDEDVRDGEDLITPIGNHVKRLLKKAEDLRAATESALKTVEEGKSAGLTFSAAREAAGFKSFVVDVEAVVSDIYQSVLNLYRLAEQASESELSDIRDDLGAFLKRHRHWQGTVEEGDE